MASSQRHRDRLAQGPGAVFSPSVAADLLPLHSDEARAWLEEQRLIHRVRGREVVLWREVLDAIAQGKLDDDEATVYELPHRVRLP